MTIVYQNQVSSLAQSQTIMEVFEDVVCSNPEKVALFSRCGILSYANLNERVNQLASHLNSLGVGPDVTVAVALERGIEYIIAMFACWKLGATYLPLDQSLPARRIVYMILDSRTTCLITVKHIMEETFFMLKVPISLCLDNQENIERLRACSSADVRPKPNNDSVAYIIYIPCTTGNPKGVAITHSSVSNLVDDIRQSREIEPSDRVLLFSSFYSDASIRDITGALVLGASLYVPQVEEILPPNNLINTIAQRGITNSVITPSVLRTCILKHLPELKTIVLAGEAADEALISTWGADRKLINAYGHTEATVCSTKQVYLNGQIPPELSASVVGTSILKTVISILDSNNIPVEHGQVGEICITGPGVSRSGYLNMPELNAERFIWGLSVHHGSYKTGDLGRVLSTGEIECLKRKESTRENKPNRQRVKLQEVDKIIRNASRVLDVVVLAQEAQHSCSLYASAVPSYYGSKQGEESLTHQRPSNPLAEHLLQCSILPYDIAYNVRPLRSRRQKHVLLTGCTGFLGSHLLAEILSTSFSKVSCLVRAPDTNAAVCRVKAALQTWGLRLDSYETCFSVFCGDVSKPFLGLSTNEYMDLARQVDTIYHSAAAVNFIAPLAELTEANITGTVEILRFASTLTPKRLTYVSTLSVFFHANSHIRCGEEAPIDDMHTGLVTGYAQSKWVSEQLVHEFSRLGGHALILRLDRLHGNTKNYRCSRDDFTIRLIASIVKLGVAPDLGDTDTLNCQFDLTPVDFCAHLIHRLSCQGTTGIRHIINKNTISFELIVSTLGGNIKLMPYRNWLQLVVSDESARSTFETLLRMVPLQCSCYQATGLDDSGARLLSTVQLLKSYLEANVGIFPSTK